MDSRPAKNVALPGLETPTPMMAQYLKLKAKAGDCLLFTGWAIFRALLR